MKLTEVSDLDEFFVNQLNKLMAHGVGTLRILSSDGRTYPVTDIRTVRSSKGQTFIRLYTLPSPDLSANSFLVKVDGIAQERELKRHDKGGFVLRKRELTEEVDHDTPLLVSMLQKLLRNHFRRQGPMVKLQDTEFGINRAYINGWSWRAGALTVHIIAEVGGREIVYPWEQTKGYLTLKHDKVEDEWVLTYDPRPR